MEDCNLHIYQVKSPAEIQSVAALAQKIWNQHYTPIIGKEQVAYMLAKFQSVDAIATQLEDHFIYFIAQTDNPVGYLSVRIETNTLFISKIYMSIDHRGKGYGKQLMNLAIKYALDRNLSILRLTVNKYNSESINAYQKMGFIQKREVVFDIGNGYVMDDYEMVLHLTSS